MPPAFVLSQDQTLNLASPVFPCGSSGKVLASYDLHRLGIDFLTDAHTYGAEGAAACASLPLLNDVKDPTLHVKGPAPTSASQSKSSAGDAKSRHRSRRNRSEERRVGKECRSRRWPKPRK